MVQDKQVIYKRIMKLIDKIRADYLSDLGNVRSEILVEQKKQSDQISAVQKQALLNKIKSI